MSFKKLLHVLTIAFLSFTFVQTTFACDRAALYLENVVNLGNNQYQIDMTFCTGGGLYGADQNTLHFAFFLAGGVTLESFPTTLTSPLTDAIYQGLPWFQDTVLYYVNDYEWWSNVGGGYGPAQAVCKEISIVTNGLPESIFLLGMEGGGNPEVSCQEEQMWVYPPEFDGNSTNPCATNNLSVSLSATQDVVYFGYDDEECTTIFGTIEGGAGSYGCIWSTGSTAESITVCPNETTAYSVTITDNTCGNQTVGTITIEVEDVRCGGNNNKVLICKKGRTRCIRQNRVAYQLSKGATLGPCGTRADYDETMLKAETPQLAISPNPFSERANIQFYIPDTDQVQVVLYSLNGQKVKTIYQGTIEANEIYRYDLEREDLSRGIYFLRLTTAKGLSQFQKVIIQ